MRQQDRSNGTGAPGSERRGKRALALVEPGWTVEEVAQYLATTPKGIYELLQQGRLPYRKLGGRYVFRPEEVAAFFHQLPGLSVADALQRCQDLGFIPDRAGECAGRESRRAQGNRR